MVKEDPLNKDHLIFRIAKFDPKTGDLLLLEDGRRYLLGLVAKGWKELRLTNKERKLAGLWGRQLDLGQRIIANSVLNAREILIQLKVTPELKKLLKEMDKLNLESNK